MAIYLSKGQYAPSHAEALLLTGQTKEARDILQTAMKHGLDTPAAQALRQRAEVAALNRSAKGEALTPIEMNQLVSLFNAGRYAELESRTRLLVERYPNSGFAWKVLGTCLQVRGKEALLALQKATVLLPDDAEAHYNLGMALQALGQLDGATSSFRRALMINPGDAEVHYNLGNLLHGLGQLDGAVSSFRRALEIKSDFAAAHYNLGNSLRALGQLDDAVVGYRRALAINPDYAEAHINLGAALNVLGQLDDAVASLCRALKIKPDYAEAHNNLGNVLQALGRLDDAVESFRRALKIKPDFADAHNNLGNALQALGQLDGAVASYRCALEIKPDVADAHTNLGAALQALGQLDGAVASFRQALNIKPDDAEVHNNLGIALQALGQFDGAVASFRRALEIKPDYAEAYGRLGGVLKTQGKLNDALACYQQQVRLMPENGEAQHHIASLTGKNSERAPIQYVENLFDSYASKFDTHLLQVLKYEAPEQLVALVTQYSPPAAEKWNVLDLGCGTGLVGLAIAPFARQLVGVDLSAKMLEQARARNLYQRLEHLDLVTMMQGEKASSYDSIIAADVFIYLGKLDAVIREIKRLLCPGGVFAFSIEALGASAKEDDRQGVQQEYRLEKTVRYTHSVKYIARLALDNGFLPKAMASAQLRMENDKPVNGYLVLWRK